VDSPNPHTGFEDDLACSINTMRTALDLRPHAAQTKRARLQVQKTIE